MHLVSKLFLAHHGDFILGPGRIRLLREVHELGSLLKASEKMGMSYRWAWGRIKKTEALLGVPLLVKCPRGSQGRPNSLTPEAKELLQWYALVEKDLNAFLRQMEETIPEFLMKLDNRPKPRKQKSQISS